MYRKLTSKKIVIPLILFLIVCTILYLIADRYLIDHVEKIIKNNSSYGNSQKASTNISDIDDWNYKSDTTEITIKKEVEGENLDKITYYIADIKVQNAKSILSAFAENKFGRNIVENTSKIAANNNAIFAINGDYYGFRNDGLVIRNGELFRDKPVRIGFALYNNGIMEAYDEEKNTSDKLLKDGVLQTLSFGPVLVNEGNAITNFDNTKVDNNFGNHSIQNSNPRTGIGYVDKNHYLFVVVDGRSRGYSKGMTLSEFALLFESLGCQEAYNLDGGGSSTMYFNGRIVNEPCGRDGERAVSDILYIKS